VGGAATARPGPPPRVNSSGLAGHRHPPVPLNPRLGGGDGVRIHEGPVRVHVLHVFVAQGGAVPEVERPNVVPREGYAQTHTREIVWLVGASPSLHRQSNDRGTHAMIESSQLRQTHSPRSVRGMHALSVRDWRGGIWRVASRVKVFPSVTWCE